MRTGKNIILYNITKTSRFCSFVGPTHRKKNLPVKAVLTSLLLPYFYITASEHDDDVIKSAQTHLYPHSNIL